MVIQHVLPGKEFSAPNMADPTSMKHSVALSNLIKWRRELRQSMKIQILGVDLERHTESTVYAQFSFSNKKKSQDVTKAVF